MAKIKFDNQPKGWGGVLDSDINGTFTGKTISKSEPVGDKAGSVKCDITEDTDAAGNKVENPKTLRVWLDPTKLPYITQEPLELVENFHVTIIKGQITDKRAM